MALGIRLIGPVYDIAGVSSNLREFALALSETGVAVQLVDVSNLTPFKAKLDEVTMQRLEIMKKTQLQGNFIAIHMTWPDKMLFIDDQAKANIAWVGFDLKKLPHVCSVILNNGKIDEVWVPTEGQKTSFEQAGVRKEKIQVVTWGVDTVNYQPGRPKLDDIREEGSYYFGFAGSLKMSCGFDIVLRAFYEEFDKDKNVKLLFKSFLGNLEGDKEAEMVKKVLGGIKGKSEAEVVYIPGNLDVGTMAKFYRTPDCLVLPGRAKAWPTSVIKGMSSGVPVITTSREDTCYDSRNTIPVKSSYQKVNEIDWLLQNPYYNDASWHEVDIADLKKTMRSVYKGDIKTESIVENARKSALKLDWKRVAMEVLKTLKPYEQRLMVKTGDEKK